MNLYWDFPQGFSFYQVEPEPFVHLCKVYNILNIIFFINHTQRKFFFFIGVKYKINADKTIFRSNRLPSIFVKCLKNYYLETYTIYSNNRQP